MAKKRMRRKEKDKKKVYNTKKNRARQGPNNKYEEEWKLKRKS